VLGLYVRDTRCCLLPLSRMRRGIMTQLLENHLVPPSDNTHHITATYLEAATEGIPKRVHAEGREDTEQDGHGLLRPDSSRDGGTAQYHRCQQAEFDTVRLTLLDPVATQAVCRQSVLSTQGEKERSSSLTQQPHSTSCNDRGHRPSPGVSSNAARRSQGREDIRRKLQTLRM